RGRRGGRPVNTGAGRMLPVGALSRPQIWRLAIRKRWTRRVIRVLIGSYIAWVGVVFCVQSRLLYQAGLAGPAIRSLAPSEGQMLWLDDGDGARVEGWFLPGAGRNAARPGPLVVYLHGNGEIIEQCLPQARMYTGRGISVLLPEYRGYGRSTGSPGQDAIVADAGRFV